MLPVTTISGLAVLPGAASIAPGESDNIVLLMSAADGLVAHAGGGQALATPITTCIARFATVATLNDSSLLPPAVAGLELTVINSGAASMNVFPSGTDTINGAAPSAAYALAAAKQAFFSCPANGKWFAISGS